MSHGIILHYPVLSSLPNKTNLNHFLFLMSPQVVPEVGTFLRCKTLVFLGKADSVRV